MPLIIFCCFLFSTTLTAQSWERIEELPFGGRYEDIYFHSEDVGWLVCSSGSVFRTEDAGENWEEVSAPGSYLRTIDFLDDAATGFIGTLNADFLMTTDAGENWQPIQELVPGEIPGICGLDHAGDHIFGVGWFAEPAFFIKSTDRGESWSFQDMSEYAAGLVECHFRNEQLGFVAGTSTTGAVILRTEDGGQSWEEVFNSNDGMEFVWKIDFVNDTLVYGSIESFTGSCSIVKSIDGGANWTEHIVSTTYRDLQGIGFLDELNGWVAPRNQPLYVTADGGETWAPTDLMRNVNRIFRAAPGLLYAGGSFVYRYNDLTVTDDFDLLPAVAHQIVNVNPNPVNTVGRVEVQLDNSTHLRLDIIDINGRRIQQVYQGNLSAGRHELLLGDLSQLTAGHYLLAMRTPEGHLSKAFLKQD